MTVDFAAASISDLADFYAAPKSAWVRSNMVISLDGHFDDSQQSSDALSSDIDLRILLLLRALSDVILVGGRTARQENYTPKPCREEFRHIARPQTRVAVITNSLDFELSNILFHGETQPILLTTDAALDNVDQDFVAALGKVSDIASCKQLDAQWVIAELAQRGLERVVCEGGPFVQNLLRQGGVLNEMDVTIAPLLMGENTSGSAFGFTPSQLSLHRLGLGANNIFARYFV